MCVKVRLVDFAHTFQHELDPHRAGTPSAGSPTVPGGRRDANFLRGLQAVIARLRSVAHLEAVEALPMV